MKKLRKNLAGFVMLMLLSTAAPLHAALTSVSGLPAGSPPILTEVPAAGAPDTVAVNLANGFPIWYKDANNLKLELCLDQAVLKQGGGTFFPCLTAAPSPTNPISFPNNFGIEAFYWTAVAFDNTLTSTVNGVRTPPWSALLVMAHEAGFFNGFGSEGNQAVFSRIRMRIAVPVPGKYRVTYPYGTRDYVVSTATGVRDINQTQDIGIFVGENFLTSLGDRPAAQLPLPPFPQPTPPSVSFIPNGVVDGAGKNIGPFLTATAPQVIAANGAVYLADPGTNLVPASVPINPGPFGNVFSIELIGDSNGGGNIPAGVILNPVDGTQRVAINQFQLMGKVFNDGPNIAPAAGPISVTTAMNTPVSIDVAPSVTDAITAANVHGFNPQAIGIFVTPSDIRRTTTFITPKFGIVQRFINTSTGKTTITYTPSTGFTGQDSFQYVVQDTGGLISAPASVSVFVENLAATGSGAVFRSKFGKWRIAGFSSSTSSNTITLATDPTALLSGSKESPAVSSQAKGTVSLISGRDTIKYFLNIAPLPASTITAVQIHYGSPGSNGPVLFDLYNSQSGPVTLPLSGQLNQSNLKQQADLGILTFPDAVTAILAGNTYVNVHTAANPSGEIRGQLLGTILGKTAVAPDGSWRFTSKSTMNPQGVRGVNAVSVNGVRLLGIPLSTR